MRVIAGKAKGRHLKTPRGCRIRPTSDLVKGAIFSVLEAMSGPYSRVLDLYAGSGSLGIEALSRGVEEAHFVDHDERCCATINQNLEATGFSEQGAVFRQDVRRSFSFLKPPYDLVFLDSPYEDPSLPEVLQELSGSPVLAAEATVVVEHSRRQPLAASYGGFSLIKTLNHGDTRVSIYKQVSG